MRKKMAVLITCYNRKAGTLECLKALFAASAQAPYVDLSVFLVDDGSTDGTGAEVQKAYPEVHVIEGSGSLYWGGGMNVAWEEAANQGSDFYMWLNDDTLLQKGAIRNLLADSARFNDNAIFVGASVWRDKPEVSYSGYLLSHKVKMVPTGIPIECDYFNGNIVLIPESVFSQVRFLDPYFKHVLGDNDYGMRARKVGIKSYVASEIAGECDGHLTLSKWCDPQVPLATRIRHFNSPKTKGPKQVFKFERRHTSLPMALFRSSIIYVRLVFPSLWILMGKPKLGEG